VDYAYRQFASLIHGYQEAVQKIENNIWQYTFLFPGKKIHVLWYDDGLPPEPEKPLEQKQVALQFSGKEVKLIPTITEFGQTWYTGKTYPLRAGKLTLNLTRIPVFVEERE